MDGKEFSVNNQPVWIVAKIRSRVAIPSCGNRYDGGTNDVKREWNVRRTRFGVFSCSRT